MVMGIETQKDQVRRFYREIWERGDHAVIAQLVVPDFNFRGSLGTQTRGQAQFGNYVDQVRRALDEYACEIEDLLAENNQVFARVLFTGIHNGTLLGFPATGRQVSWHGAALFTFENDLITRLWVLGDLTTLRGQLAEPHR